MANPGNQFLKAYLSGPGNKGEEVASLWDAGNRRPDKFYPGSGPKFEGYYRRPVPGLGANDWSEYDKDMPNPFGGGSGPYVPGAMLPGMQNGALAAVPHPGPYPYGQPDKFDAYEKAYGAYQQDQLKRRQWLEQQEEPPNPFGGGGGGYVRGV